MRCAMRSLAFILFQGALISVTSSEAGTTTCFPTMWASDPSSTTTSISSAMTTNTRSAEPITTPEPRPMKTLLVCCCCLASAIDEPQPAVDHYLGECSKAGTRDVCGSNYTGSSGYAMEGLEGHPEEIHAVCSISRCGAMRYVD